MFQWLFGLLLATSPFLIGAVDPGESLLDNLLQYEIDSKLCCSICLEDFYLGEPIFASHPVDMSEKEPEVEYPRMHLLHIKCAIENMRLINIKCPLCKVPIRAAETEFGPQFIAAVFDFPSLIEYYGKGMSMALLVVLIRWMAEAVIYANRTQNAIIDNILRERPAPPDAFREAASIIELACMQRTPIPFRFRQLLFALQPELFQILKITEETFQVLNIHKLLRYYLLNGMADNERFESNIDFWTSFLIMQHLTGGFAKLNAAVYRYNLEHIQLEPLFMEYLIHFGDLSLAKKLLIELKVPSKPFLRRAMNFIFHSNQSISLMRKYAHFLPSIHGEFVFVEFFRGLRHRNYLDKAFLLFKHAGNATRQLAIVPFLTRIFVEQPSLMRYYANEAEDFRVIRSLTILAIENGISESLYIIAQYTAIDPILLIGIVSALIIQREFCVERLQQKILIAISNSNSHLLIYPLQLADQSQDREAFNFFAQFFHSAHFVWLTLGPFSNSSPIRMKEAFLRAKDESFQTLIYGFIHINPTALINYFELGISLSTRYCRLLLVQCEMLNLPRECAYLRNILNLVEKTRFPAELEKELFTCHALNKITWLTIKLNSLMQTDSIQANFWINQITDPFYYVAIIAIAIRFNYSALYSAMIGSAPEEYNDLMEIAAQYLILTNTHSIANYLVRKISFSSPALLIAFFSGIAEMPHLAFYSLVSKFIVALDSRHWTLLYWLLFDNLQKYQMLHVVQLTRIFRLLPTMYLEVLAVYAESKCIFGFRAFIESVEKNNLGQ